MKRILLSLIALAITVASANAPNHYYEEKNVSFMGLFGMNISNMHYKNQPGMELNPKAGFNLGVRAEYVLPSCHGVFVNAGLEYTMKGGRDKIEVGIDDMLGIGCTYIARPCYISIPVHVGYRYDVLDVLGVYADFGPYFAIGTNGKFRTKFDDFSDDVTERIFKKDDGMRSSKRFDCGLGFRVGAEYAKHYNFILGFDWGLTDMYTQDMKHYLHQEGATDAACKNFCASLTFGYRF